MIKPFILSGYLAFSEERSDYIQFFRPILKKDSEGDRTGDNTFFWIDSSTLGHFTADIIPLDPDYKTYLHPKDQSLKRPVNIDMNHPFYLIKVNQMFFCGSPHGLLQSLFSEYSESEIRKYDVDGVLIRFMIRNKDNKYLVEQYLPSFSTKDLMLQLMDILETSKLNHLHKRDFFTKTLKKNPTVDNRVFEGFEEEDFVALKKLLQAELFGKEAIEVINEHQKIPYLFC